MRSQSQLRNDKYIIMMFIIVLAVLNSIATEVVEEEALVDQIKVQTGGQDKEIQIVSHHGGFQETPTP